MKVLLILIVTFIADGEDEEMESFAEGFAHLAAIEYLDQCLIV